jgi:hypothetical protein
VGPGLVLWGPKAAIKREACTRALSEFLDSKGFRRTYTPYILRWETWEKYQRQLHASPIWLRSHNDNGEDYAFGASKAIQHMLMVQADFKSYRDLPICLYEFCEIYRQGLSLGETVETAPEKVTVTNHFGVTLSVFDTRTIENALTDIMTQTAHVASDHGFATPFAADGLVRWGTPPDDDYISEDGRKHPISATWANCRMEIDVPNATAEW